MSSGSKLAVSGACTSRSTGSSEQGLVWREIVEPAGWQRISVCWWAGMMAGATCGLGVRVGSTGDVQVVDEMLNSGVPIRE